MVFEMVEPYTGKEELMPYAMTDDGVNLYYEETGSGEPILFIHEFLKPQPYRVR